MIICYFTHEKERDLPGLVKVDCRLFSFIGRAFMFVSSANENAGQL